MSNNEDDSKSNAHFDIASHSIVDIETDFDINEGHSIVYIARLQDNENTNGKSTMQSLFHIIHDDSSVESISLAAKSHPIDSNCANTTDVSAETS